MWLYDSCIWVEWLLKSRIGTSLKAEFLTYRNINRANAGAV